MTDQQQIRIFDSGLKIVFKQALLYAICLTNSVDHLQSWIKPVRKIVTVRNAQQTVKSAQQITTEYILLKTFNMFAQEDWHIHHKKQNITSV